MAESLRSSRNRSWLMGLLLVGITFLAYLPVFRGQFVWDDDAWTTKIDGLLRDVSGLRLIWCQFTALQQYYPLTATTFWLDYHLWGFWPLPYHVENVLLHALAALLFWRLLKRLGVAGVWLAAAIFALHPVMVESAGWITERKNVLSLVLYLGALLAYDRFNGFWQADVDAPERTSRWRWGHYTMALFLFLGALLAKTTAFSLPAVLLLIVWWKGGRLRWRAEVLPTLPFFVLSFGMCLVTAWLEKNHVGAQGPDFALTLPERCLIAGRVPWFYLGHLLWPAGLCFIYPRWPLNAGSWQQWLYPVTAVSVLLALWLARKRIGRGPAAAAFFFAGTLFPVLGFMNAYGMSYSYVWDHWVYLSSLGPIALAAAGMAAALDRLEKQRPGLKPAFGGTVLLVLGLLTWRQCQMYSDAETLWRTTIARNPDAWMAYDNLGIILSRKGEVDEAMTLFEKTLAIRPDDALTRNNLGLVLCQKGRIDEAIVQFQKALAALPNSALIRNSLGKAFLAKGQQREAIIQFQKVLESDSGEPMANCNLGIILFQKGRVDKAIGCFQKALATQPDFVLARDNLGTALLQKGQEREALAQFQTALEYDPDDPTAHYNLGVFQFQKGQTDRAIAHFRKALETRPEFVEAHNNLGVALLKKGMLDEAIGQFQYALELRPDFADAWENLNDAAWQLAASPAASVRNGARALALARQLDRASGGNNPVVLDTLAAAYAETGQFPAAIEAAQRALALATAQSNAALADTLRRHLQLLQTGFPLRSDSPPDTAPKPDWR